MCGKILEHLPCAAEALFVGFPPFNIIKGVLGALAYPLFPAFWALNRAVLTLKRGVLTPGLPHAYPVPEVCLPRLVPPRSCIVAFTRTALTLKRGSLPHAFPGAYPVPANGIWGVFLSCLPELFHRLISR